MMWDYGGHMSGWAWAFTGFGMLLFWAALITAIVLLVRYLNGAKQVPRDSDLPAAEILARRFARGEISEDEFLSRSKLIKH